jgi:F0F1-type ATP synthase delta subunit
MNYKSFAKALITLAESGNYSPDKLARTTFELLQKYRLESLAPTIVKDISNYRERTKGADTITVAGSITPETRELLISHYHLSPDTKVAIDPEIIGGYTITTNSTIIDASVQHNLQQLRNHLLPTA